MRFGAWLKLLSDGGFDVTLNCLPRIASVTLVSPLNSLGHHATEAIYGRRLADLKVEPPLFVLGHWRTGTTLLHELLGCDPAFACPNTYQCMFPNSFLLTERLFSGLNFLLPDTRPFDNVKMGFDRPQEEEFALAILGTGTPYYTLAFPRHDAHGMRYLDLSELTEAERAAWESGYLGLVKRFQLAAGKPLILKSPVNTARISTLLRLFPEARFVHIARHPFDVFPSTLHTRKVLGSGQGLHNPIPPDDTWLREHVLEVFEQMYRAYAADRHLISAGRLVELRYEDLDADPKGVLAEIYRSLDLGDFTQAEPAVDAYLDERRDYERNSYDVSDADRERVEARWRPYFERFGYDLSG